MRTHRWQQDLPFLALLALALAAPVVVLGQGGDLAAALFACPAVLASAAIAVEAMAGLAQVTLLAERRRR